MNRKFLAAALAVVSITGLAGCATVVDPTRAPVHVGVVVVPRDGLAMGPLARHADQVRITAAAQAEVAAQVAAAQAAQAAAVQAAQVVRHAPRPAAPAPRPAAPAAPHVAAPAPAQAPASRAAFVGCAGLQAAVDSCGSWTLLAYNLPFPTIGAHVNRAGGWLLGVGVGATVTVSGRLGGVYQVIGSTYVPRDGTTANVRGAAPAGTSLAMQTCAWNHSTGMRFVFLRRIG